MNNHSNFLPVQSTQRRGWRP